MIYLAILGATALSCELVFWLPVVKTSKILLETLHQARKVLLSKHISDDWKEKILPVYAFRIFKHSLFLPVLIILILTPVFIASWLLSESPIDAALLLTRPFILLLMILVSTLYITIRIRIAR